MSRFTIRDPWWDGEKVGLVESKLSPSNTVVILYKNTAGKRVYPHTYSISGSKAREYPVYYTKESKTKLRIIPIADLKVGEI